MQYTYEFEIYKHKRHFIAECRDFGIVTQGKDVEQAYEMAEDILKLSIEELLMSETSLPQATYQTEAIHGGLIAVITVDVDIHDIKALTAQEASKHLGISTGRVSQLVSKGLLEGFKRDGISWITIDSINARLAEKPKCGRPSKDSKHIASTQTTIFAGAH